MSSITFQNARSSDRGAVPVDAEAALLGNELADLRRGAGVEHVIEHVVDS
jgi:hypothetical protein